MVRKRTPSNLKLVTPRVKAKQKAKLRRVGKHPALAAPYGRQSEYAEAQPKKLPYPHAVLQAGARAAFKLMQRIIGEEKNARIKPFDKQPTFIQKKWREFVQEILDAAGLGYAP